MTKGSMENISVSVTGTCMICGSKVSVPLGPENVVFGLAERVNIKCPECSFVLLDNEALAELID